MSYQYSRLPSDIQRDVAHWRGAKSGMRVLSLPSCAGWLQRQANDASYDFWADRAIVAPLRTHGAPVVLAPEGTEALVLHKEADGSWLSFPWQAMQAVKGTAAADSGGDSTSFIIEISASRR